MAQGDRVRGVEWVCAQHGGAAPYLAVDWVQAGLRPPPRETSVLWNAMLAHFNAGEHVYGAEDGAANSATVASAVTGGGELHHGAHVCCCGYQGRVDGRHWLTECDRGPTREVRARAAAELRSVGADLLAPAEKVPQATLRAIEQAARVLCGRPGRGRAASSAELPPPDPAVAPAWCAAVLTACGGVPHPGREGIHQAYARLPKGEREAGGDKVSKEAPTSPASNPAASTPVLLEAEAINSRDICIGMCSRIAKGRLRSSPLRSEPAEPTSPASNPVASTPVLLEAEAFNSQDFCFTPFDLGMWAIFCDSLIGNKQTRDLHSNDALLCIHADSATALMDSRHLALALLAKLA